MLKQSLRTWHRIGWRVQLGLNRLKRTQLLLFPELYDRSPRQADRVNFVEGELVIEAPEQEHQHDAQQADGFRLHGQTPTRSAPQRAFVPVAPSRSRAYEGRTVTYVFQRSDPLKTLPRHSTSVH